MKLDDLLAKLSQIPFDPKEVGTWEMPGCTVKEMTIQSTPGRRIETVLTIPQKSEGPLPAVVCIGGHGFNQFSVYTNGKAFGPHPADATDGSPIYKGFGSELAKSYVTISTLVSQHNVYEPGRTLMGERLWDLMALRQLSGVVAERQQNPHRFWRALARRRNDDVAFAMDTRIAAADSSGWLTTMDHLEANHCLCWKFPGLRNSLTGPTF